jgi:hypothetical protein
MDLIQVTIIHSPERRFTNVKGKALDGHSNIAVETNLNEAFKMRFKVERFLNRSLWVFSPEVVHIS